MRGLSKRYTVLLLLMVLSLASLPSILPSYGLHDSSEVRIEDKVQISVKDKFEPDFWDKIQRLKANGTTGNLSVIIRLVRNQSITNIRLKELKDYAASLLQSNHNATVYYKCKVLP